MSPMGCDEIRELIPLFVGEDLPERDRADVEAHVAACSACARELDLYREARTGLAAIREDEAPAGTWTRMWKDVRAELFPRPTSRAFRILDAAVRYAAAFAIGISVGFVLYRFQPQRAADPVPSAVFEDASRLRELPHAAEFSVPGPMPELRREQPHAAPRRGGVEYFLPRVDSVPPPDEKGF